jgi:hypothetical protein
LVQAQKFDHNLTLQFGFLSGHCKDEEEYLSKSVKVIKELKEMDDDELEYHVFFGETFNRKELNAALDKILKNISKLTAKA